MGCHIFGWHQRGRQLSLGVLLGQSWKDFVTKIHIRPAWCSAAPGFSWIPACSPCADAFIALKIRLFHRRLTVSSPRMAIRSSLAWPLRWVLGALMLGFCGALALWAFETGKAWAGLDRKAVEDLKGLRREVVLLRDEREKAQSIANTADTLLTAERSAQQKLLDQVRQLEVENRSLRDDLGFFEKLLPAGVNDVASIRGLKAEVLSDSQLRWQALVIQPAKAPRDFDGTLELSVSGLSAGKEWTATLPAGPQALQFRQYRRVEGLLTLPPQTVVKSVTAKVMEGKVLRAVQTLRL